MKLIYVVAYLFFLIIPSFAHAQKKYNVIFISIDDLGIGFETYGNPEVPTPNINRLAQHGMQFQQVYTHYPLCSPSRTALFSGKRPDSTRVINNGVSIRSFLGADYKFLPEYFGAYGYRSERYGKVGPCGHDDEINWDYNFYGGLGNDQGFFDIPTWWIDTVPKNISETKGGVIVDSVVRRIVNPVSQPYFYGLGLAVHNPFSPIISSWDKLGDNNIKELMPVDRYGTITNVLGNGSANIILPDTPSDDTLDIPYPALKDALFYTPYEVQQRRHAYYAEIISLDAQLGNLLDTLDRLKLWDSSVIVFWSDHGLHMGEHEGQWAKMTLFEEVMRVPLIICAPGKKAGICYNPVELVDIFPTLTELCGLPPAPDMEGSSLVPLLENPVIEWKKAVFSQRALFPGNSRMGRAVRTNQYHYNTWLEYGEELYDIQNDPKEYTNLALNPAFNLVLDTMRSLLNNGWQGALPPVYLKQSFFRDDDGDGYGKSNDSIVDYFAPEGYVTKSGDCNDSNPKIHPNAKERYCNQKDDNCNGQVDENRPVPKINTLGSLDICLTGSVILQTNSGNGFNYQWRRNGKNIPGAVYRKFNATSVGEYSVIITYQGQCDNISDPVKVYNSCFLLKPDKDSSSEISIIPNPSNGLCTISYDNKDAPGILNLKIYDRLGNLVYNKPDKMISGVNAFKLNLSGLLPGVYHVELNNGVITLVNKLILEK